ncbi:VCBS repeat-containing protein [Propionivibrio limicola]|uniref:VCBS repeat-containing protein n=1 Tax=Propionivibrio limicola TaxID=167645 RepID=UPI0012910C49|nr:VCBS repeat-containing protein [Propionivibrio limicola]
MRISSSALQLEASHSSFQRHEVSESLRAWVGNARPREAGNATNGRNDAQTEKLSAIAALSSTLATNPLNTDTVDISDAAQAAESNQANAIEEGFEAAENDPIVRLIRAMIAVLTGEEPRVFSASERQGDNETYAPARGANPPASNTPSAGYGIEYDRHESYTESESTQFAAAGIVRTEDGQEIRFAMSLSMSRVYHEESNISLRLGDARQTKDPLVINFNGNAAQLTDQRFSFDLNADGQTAEQINFVTQGSGFLAFDRNGDGAITSGAELFGALTGDGFAELARLDADSNGWIDENDAAFEKLAVWTKDGDGNDRLAAMKEANVGAISLERVATPFDIKDSGNGLQGHVRTTGIYLQESGAAGTVQQVDLTV